MSSFHGVDFKPNPVFMPTQHVGYKARSLQQRIKPAVADPSLRAGKRQKTGSSLEEGGEGGPFYGFELMSEKDCTVGEIIIYSDATVL